MYFNWTHLFNNTYKCPIYYNSGGLEYHRKKESQSFPSFQYFISSKLVLEFFILEINLINEFKLIKEVCFLINHQNQVLKVNVSD